MSRTWLSLLGFLALWPGSVQAHDIYSDLLDPKGASCCHDHDCKPAPYRLTAAGVQMFIDGRWLAVSDDTISYLTLPGDSGETAGGHWCGTTVDVDVGAVYLTRCAVLPPRSAALRRSIPQTAFRDLSDR
jgi:hypothetical protein